MPKIPSINDLAKAGVHLGHRTSRLNPKMKPFLFGQKNTIDLIDLDSTVQSIEKALKFIKESAGQGKTILFLGTKPAAREIIQKSAEKVNMPYVKERWIAGLLTNFGTVSHLIKKFKKMKDGQSTDDWKKYTKKEQLDMEREVDRLKIMVGGIESLTKVPDLIYIVDILKEKTALREAQKCQIPVIAMIDSNNNPEKVAYPILANDDAIKSIEIITELITEAILEGQKNVKTTTIPKDEKKEENKPEDKEEKKDKEQDETEEGEKDKE